MNNATLADVGKRSSEFTQKYLDRLFENGGMFECYLQAKPKILAFLDAMVMNDNAVSDLDAALAPMRELGFFHEHYFNNLILSFEIDQNVKDATTKQRLLAVVDASVKPRNKANELERFIAAYLFVRLQQCGASFHQCSQFFGFLKQPRRKAPDADRALEKTVVNLKQVLPSFNDIPWFLHLFDAAALFYLARVMPSLTAYQSKLANRKPEAQEAFENGFMVPLNGFLEQSIVCFGRKNAQIPEDFASKFNKAATLAYSHVGAIAQGDVRKFNSTV